MIFGFLMMMVASLKMSSRTTSSMTPREPPPSKDKIDVIFRRRFAGAPLEGAVGVVGGGTHAILSLKRKTNDKIVGF